MTDMPDTRAASPFATLWLSPRATIERIVATRPTYLVVPLAMAGTVALFYLELLVGGLTGHLTNWRFWLGVVIGGALYGIAWLYLSALVMKWIGRMLGGEATALQLRAAVAWSMVPPIAAALIAIVAGVLVNMTGSGQMIVKIGVSLLTFVVGLWALVIFLLMVGRLERFGFWRTMLTYVLSTVLISFLAAIGIRSMLYQPFNIPSGAMTPTLVIGDYFFAAKFPYGYSRFSLPFSPPLFSGRILAAEPQRGDVVIFRVPNDERVDYIKRLVGLPGERIQMKGGELYINDVPVKREQVADYVGVDLCGSTGKAPVKRWRETLPNGVSYETLDCIDNSFLDNTAVYTVPAGHYFLLGDNRDKSNDSRVLKSVGYIPLQNLVGRADLIFFSKDPETREVRDERIGTRVR